MSTVEPDLARDRWCWPRPDENDENEERVSDDEKVVDAVEIEISGFGETDAEPVCRICLEETLPLIASPCLCAGTQRWVHEACLRRWRTSAGGRRLLECEVCRSQYTDVEGESFSYAISSSIGSEEEDANTAHCPMSLAWATLLTSQMLSFAVLISFMLLAGANDATSKATEPWGSTMTVSTVLNVGVLIHVFSWTKKYRWIMFIFAMVQTLLVMWEYTPVTHSVSNIGCGFLLAGVMSHRKIRQHADIVNADDANDR